MKILCNEINNLNNNSFYQLLSQQFKQHTKEQNKLLAEKISIIENRYLSEEDILLLNSNDLQAIVYNHDPQWTHYYYKGQRILSLGPIEFKKTKQEDDIYVVAITQQYY